MDAITCLETRRSVRSFEERKVEREVLEKIVKTASYAPSWKNTQTARYIVVEGDELKSKIANEATLGFVYNANVIKKCPALAVVTCIHGRSGFERDGSYSTSKEDRWEVFDAGIATQTFCLSAHANGIGTVILGIFDEEKVKELVGVKDEQVVCALVALGYPAEGEIKAPKRKEVNELLSFVN